MKLQYIISVFLFWLCLGFKSEAQEIKLWYKQPADAGAKDNPNGWVDDQHWLNALPLGNGSLGVMVFGDVNKERIQLNEESMWSGSPEDNDNPEAYASLDSIRQLLFAGKYKEATQLTNKTQVCRGAGSGSGNGANVPFGCFQTMGDLWIDFKNEGECENYYRELDLQDAVVRIGYTQDGVQYKREIFTSYPDQVMVARFSASQKGKISFKCTMTRPEQYTTYTENDQLIMHGALSDGKGGKGLQYMSRLKAISNTGNITYNDAELVVENADEVLLLLSASTSHKLEYPDYSGRDFETITEKNLEEAVRRSYDQLLNSHIDEYQQYFSRVSFDLTTSTPDTIPTDQRVETFRKGKWDPYLYELIFQYGRYLLISSSRPGTLPANLQGIWANKIQTPWNGDYHTDVNVEMNYWPAEVTALPEMHRPLFDFISSLTEPGKKTARTHYNAEGWVVHPITNIWGYTSPGENAAWGMHTGATAWISQHIMEHYRFTGDKAFLAEMYPVLKSAVQFYLDWLVEHPETGKLISGPAVSPENTFVAPDGSNAQISMGPAHDQQVIWQLFEDFSAASQVLEVNDDFVSEVSEAQSRLAVSQIGSDGRLMEWAHEFPEAEPGHRHISHLWALHPGAQINPLTSPELAEAAGKSLDFRMKSGGGHTGWSAAWLINQYARLHQPENAKKSLDVVLSNSTSPNLFGFYPPFQMDANFGTTAGIAEMLLQSHVKTKDGLYIIHLLPALPQAWQNGSIEGLRARGGVTVNLAWNDGQLSAADLVSDSGDPFIVRYEGKEQQVNPTAGKKIILNENLMIK